MSTTFRPLCVCLAAALMTAVIPPHAAQLPSLTFGRGDIFISLEPGPVQWRRPDGSLRAVLLQTVVGTGEGMAFDANGNLYVTRWALDASRLTGNTVEKYNSLGLSLGAVGEGYNCEPHTIVFDGSGNGYVGQAGCNGSILRFDPNWTQAAEFRAAPDGMGTFWMDLTDDGCTMFYTSWGPNVKRFNLCDGRQLADFNDRPLPGGETQDLRLLADGGVLVASGQVVVRLDARGALVQTYRAPDEEALWAGLDVLDDGTFWVGNYRTSNVYRFDLETGGVKGRFNTGTEPNTVVGIRVRK